MHRFGGLCRHREGGVCDLHELCACAVRALLLVQGQREESLCDLQSKDSGVSIMHGAGVRVFTMSQVQDRRSSGTKAHV